MCHDKDRHASGEHIWMLLPQKRAGQRNEMIENQALCFLLPTSYMVQGFDVITHTQAVSLTKALFK